MIIDLKPNPLENLPLMNGEEISLVPARDASGREDSAPVKEDERAGAASSKGASTSNKRKKPQTDTPQIESFHMLRGLLSKEKYPFEDGRVLVKVGTGDEEERHPLCAVFGVLGRVADASGNQWSLLLEIQDPAGDLKIVRASRADIQSHPKKIRAALADVGLWISPSADTKFEEMLNSLQPETHITLVNRPGWWEGAFVNADGRVFGATSRTFILEDRTRGGVAGSLDQQLDAYRTALNSGVAHFAMCVFAGTAGCICNYVGMNTPIMAFTGETSRGKTTGLVIAAAAWGDPMPSKGCLDTLRATDNGLESVLERCSGRVSCLDEAKHMKGSVLQAVIFMIADGKGKSRMNADSTARPSKNWQTFALISSEVGIAEKIEADGDMAAGGLVRCADFDISDAPQLDRATMKEIEQVKMNYGHTGPMAAQWLAEHASPEQVLEWVEETAQRLAGPGASSIVHRSATIFAVLLVGGEVYQKCGVIGPDYNVEAMIRLCWSKFRASAEAERLSPDDRAVAALMTGLFAHRGGRVQDLNNDDPRSSTEAYAWFDDRADSGTVMYYVRSDKLDVLAGGTAKRSRIAAKLLDMGVLVRADKRNLTHKSLPNGMDISHYQLQVAPKAKAAE